MIRQLRLLVAGVLALIAVGAVASATASAAGCVASTGGACISILTVLTESTVLLAKNEAPVPKLKAEGIGTVECETSTAEPTIDETATAGLTILPFDITFSGNCKLEGSPTCLADEPILTANITGTVSALEGTSGDANFAPSSGTLFATVVILHSVGQECEHEAKVVVTGTQLCKITKMEEELTLHLLECNAGEGKLKNGTKAAEFIAKYDLTLEPEDDVAILLNLF